MVRRRAGRLHLMIRTFLITAGLIAVCGARAWAQKPLRVIAFGDSTTAPRAGVEVQGGLGAAYSFE